jgi:hypothetical protein
VIDLKSKPFMPEDAGKIYFYLNAVEDLLRHPDDQPSIGLVLCRKKGGNKLVLEYALRGLEKPIGVSEYELTRALPEDLQPILPTIEQTEREIAGSIEYSDDTNTGQMLKELQLEYGMRRAGYETVVRNRVGFWRWSVG